MARHAQAQTTRFVVRHQRHPPRGERAAEASGLVGTTANVDAVPGDQRAEAPRGRRLAQRNLESELRAGYVGHAEHHASTV
jgi:hypothetical protein